MKAMREALESVSKAFDDELICTDFQMSDEDLDRLDAIYHQVKDALAEPPRNCDKFNTGDAERDAEMAWNAITSEKDLQFSDLTDREIAIIKEAMRGFVWLFATAKESEVAK